MNSIINRVNHSHTFSIIFLVVAATLILAGFAFWVAVGINLAVALSMGAGFFMLATYKMQGPEQK